jgi:lysophospholipase L1-like esterase
MARVITFAQFQQRLREGRLTEDEIRDYLELDPEAINVRVRIRPGVLADAPPADYDLDDELSEYQIRKDARAARAAAGKGRLPKVVAAGDSWFLLPTILPPVPAAIAQWLQIKNGFGVWHVGRWGYTLKRLLEERRYPDAIKRRRPDWFIVSAGGNDVQRALPCGEALRRYDPNRPLEESLTSKGEGMLRNVGTGYRTLLADVRRSFSLPIVCYGYDYPRPQVANGRYIGRHLRDYGYPADTHRRVAEVILDRLNDEIANAVAEFPNARFLNCRRVTDRYTWWDDMHPADDGFKELAARFAKEMAPPGKARSVKRRRRGKAT